jgi:probable addiction module antidote protein
MKKRRIRTSELPEFDVSKYLNDEASIAEYLMMVIEQDDPALLAATLGDIAKARGLSEVPKR